MKKIFLVLALLAPAAFGQTTASAVAQGTSFPATCRLGSTFTRTDQTAGTNLYVCDASNSWFSVAGAGYSLPIATAGALGGIKVGSGLSINAGTGVLSASGAGSGTVTSVGVATPSWLTPSAAITTAGTITLSPTTAQSSHQVIGTCGSATTFAPCTLVGGDIPQINLATSGAGGVGGITAIANGGSGTNAPALIAGSNVTITGTWPNNTISASGGGGGGTLFSLTDLKPSASGTTTISIGAPTLDTTVGSTAYPLTGASTIGISGTAADTVYVDVNLAGQREIWKNSANTYSLTNFEDASPNTGTAFAAGSYHIAICTVASGGATYTCHDSRPLQAAPGVFQAQGGGVQVIPASAGGLVANSTNLVTSNTATTYAIDPFTDWGRTNNFNTAVNGAAAVSLAQASTPGTCGSGQCNFANGWHARVGNSSITGSTLVTVTTVAGSLFYGLGSAGALSFTISPGQQYEITSDGTNYLLSQTYAGSGGGSTFTAIATGTNIGSIMTCSSSCLVTGNVNANAITGVNSGDLGDHANIPLLSTANAFADVQSITKNGGTDILQLTNTTAATGDSFIKWTGPSASVAEMGIINSGGCVNTLAIAINGSAAVCWPTGTGFTNFRKGVTMVTSALIESTATQSFSTTPAFSWTLTNTLNLVMTGNVTSSTSTGAATGQKVTVFIIEDATGGRTFSPPTTWHGFPGVTTSPQTNANQINAFSCVFRSATDCYGTSFLSYQP